MAYIERTAFDFRRSASNARRRRKRRATTCGIVIAVLAWFGAASAQAQGPIGGADFPLKDQSERCRWTEAAKALNSIVEAINARNSIEKVLAVPEESNVSSLSALQFTLLARHVYPRDRDKGIIYFQVGWLRARFDAKRCEAKSVSGGVQLIMTLAGPDLTTFLLQDPPKAKSAFVRVSDHVLSLEAGMSTNSDPTLTCLMGMATGDRKKMDLAGCKAESKWEQIRAENRENFSVMIEGYRRETSP